MTDRVYNFNPGPAALPLPVLQQVQHELLDFNGSGMSILEVSHRSDIYHRVHEQVQDNLRHLLLAADDYDFLFMAGGAQTQFALVPMNLLHPHSFAQYLITGSWSLNALHEGQKIGDTRMLWSSQATGFNKVPALDDYVVDPAARYLHYTTNNTIAGTQFHHIPAAASVPLIADMSSDILSGPLDVSPYQLIYAGAQKNIGVAGVTLVIIKRDVLPRCRSDLPSMLCYAQVAGKNSVLNTPPVFAIYIMSLVTQYLIDLGGLAAVAERNVKKAERLYQVIDASGGFYRGWAERSSRSIMNVTYRLPSPEMEQRFLQGAVQADMVGLEGHRSMGGIRASLYNAVSFEAVEHLCEFMIAFAQKWG